MVEPNDPGTTVDRGAAPSAGDDPADPISRFAPHLREEFEKLRRSEERIVKALADPEVAGRFSVDPARALQEIGVEVPPALKSRLASARPGVPMPTERRFRLPNGQVVTAHVKVRFTRGKGR
jgi:hypothetical protein